MTFDVYEIRKDFPMFENNPDLIYMDSAATSLKPQCVIDAVTSFYTHHTSNVHRGDYEIAALNDRLYDGCREKTARLINCDPGEIVYTHNISHSLNQVALGLAQQLKEGDVVLTSMAEHASDLLPWFTLQKEKGIRIEYVPTDIQANITVEDFEKAMHEGVRVVALAHVTNVLGSVIPIREIAAIAHRYGAVVVVDGAQAVPHMKVDVRDLDVDFYGFSAHKMCGPSGVGVLYGKKELLKQLKPVFTGGDMNARFNKDGEIILKDVPVRFEAGTPNIEGVIGMGAAIDYLMSIGMDEIEQYEVQLRAYFCEKMKQLDNIELLNPDNTHGPITFNVKGIFAQDGAGVLANRNIAVRSGNHCAKILHEITGTDQSIRASLYFYNTKEEVDRFVEATKEITLENAVGIFF